MTGVEVRPGLNGVVAAETRISEVDGQAGRLVIRGFPVEELAGRATFEEIVYLLWHGTLPTSTEVDHLSAELASRRELPPITLEVLRAAAAAHVPVMDTLGMASTTLGLGMPGRSDGNAPAGALEIAARIPTLIAAYWRLLQGQSPVIPRADLGHAADYLRMLTGDEAPQEQVEALETYLCTVVDHGLNASTFAARVIISTRSDLLSAVVGALGALKGPLHGGAPGPALDMVFEIGEAERAEPFLRAKLERGERLMGFGHRIYKVRDPRADLLARAADRLYREGDDMRIYSLALHVEQEALRLLEESKPGRHLQTNVEFYTALLLHGIGLPTNLFTPTFAAGRVIGWIAHCIEQQQVDRLIRPESTYVGDRNCKWTPISARQ